MDCSRKPEYPRMPRENTQMPQTNSNQETLQLWGDDAHHHTTVQPKEEVVSPENIWSMKQIPKQALLVFAHKFSNFTLHFSTMKSIKTWQLPEILIIFTVWAYRLIIHLSQLSEAKRSGPSWTDHQSITGPYSVFIHLIPACTSEPHTMKWKQPLFKPSFMSFIMTIIRQIYRNRNKFPTFTWEHFHLIITTLS